MKDYEHNGSVSARDTCGNIYEYPARRDLNRGIFACFFLSISFFFKPFLFRFTLQICPKPILRQILTFLAVSFYFSFFFFFPFSSTVMFFGI